MTYNVQARVVTMRASVTAGAILALTYVLAITTAQAAECAVDAKGKCKPINKTCDDLKGNQIDWNCIFGPGSLEEVNERGGKFTVCKYATSKEPCSRFIVTKDNERAEVKVQEGPEGFPFLMGEEYIFKYSFRAVDGMQVTDRFTHLGQLKSSKGGYMITGDPIYSLTANDKGLQVRFSNKDTIVDYEPGLPTALDWEAATGKWVHVKITTVFGKSMEVEISGPVEGKAVWPSHLKPIAWNDDGDMVRMKLGLYHSTHNVADGDVEYRNISIEGPNGIIRTSKEDNDDDNSGSGNQQCTIDKATGQCEIVDITCEALSGNQIDWECVFGPGALEEVHQRGGQFTTCPKASKLEPCSRFIVEKEKERSEVKVQEGPPGFTFLKGEKYIFKYSFRAKEGMKVSDKFTHLGQLKGSMNGYMVYGDPIYSLTANSDGIMVRFSNKESIEVFHEGLSKHLSWEDASGEWVHVQITTVFGKSMEVEISGAVNGKATWPSDLKPVAWHNGGDMVRMKLGLYHSTNNVADGEVEYKNISIEGPRGIIRTSSLGVPDEGIPEGVLYVGCIRDEMQDRVLPIKYTDSKMTIEKCADYCEGETFFGLQWGKECWCGSESANISKHSKTPTCDYPCVGDADETCGGNNALSLFKYGGSPAGVPEGTKYLGCYRDNPASRVLSMRMTASDDMTPEVCSAFCKMYKAKYFGLQYSKECHCGYQTDTYDRLGTNTCDMKCSGDANMCGGSRALSTYLIY